MNTPLRIKSTATGQELPCQRIYVTGVHPLIGQVECPGVAELPSADDREFDVLPLGFRIRFTSAKFESGKASFAVIATP